MVYATGRASIVVHVKQCNLNIPRYVMITWSPQHTRESSIPGTGWYMWSMPSWTARHGWPLHKSSLHICNQVFVASILGVIWCALAGKLLWDCNLRCQYWVARGIPATCCCGGPRNYLMQGWWAHDPNLVKTYDAVTWKIIIRSDNKFAHVTTAQLPWHVQKCDLIRW